ncbi:MAG: glutathione synthase [Bacteriovoracaceae bacterium]|jgi:glutathione synthase
MRHILFIDPLEKLTIKKDSTLFFAHTLKEQGHEVFMLFEKDFHFINRGKAELNCYPFESSMVENSFYVKEFKLGEALRLDINQNDILHMRLDPPFDTRYLRYLWMLKAMRTAVGVKVLNNPDGILLYNEKLAALEKPSSLETFVGSGAIDFVKFIERLKSQNITSAILKPLDLYQGIGVEKIELKTDINDLKEHFLKRASEFKGPVIIQPFDEKVIEGEIRSIFFKGVEIGSIVKVPPKGSFLANIAQGATYSVAELNPVQKKNCAVLCEELSRVGADWLAFDILGDNISEVNVTCPGLLVEVSDAMKKNLAQEILGLM